MVDIFSVRRRGQIRMARLNSLFAGFANILCFYPGFDLLIVGLCLGWLNQAGWGEEAGTAITVPVCAVPPKLDTDLTDPAWQSATKLTTFYELGAEGNPVEIPITAWLGRDDTWLYIAFRCLEPKPATVQRQVTERDGPVSQDDSIEVFIDPGTDGTRYYQFMLTAGNVQADQACAGSHRNRSWNVPWRSAARLDPHIDSAKGWSAELAIPLAPLQAAAGTNEWRINLCRNRRAVDPVEYSSLAKLLPRSGFHAPEAFLPMTGLTGFKAPTVFGPMVKQVKVNPLRVEGDKAFYGVEVVVGNDSGKTGMVEVVVQDQPLKGTGTQGRKTLSLNPVDEQSASFRIEIPDISRRDAWVILREPGSDQWIQKTDIAGMDLLSPFDTYVERNYYTTEKEARVWVEMRVGREERERAGFTVKVELLDERGKVLAKNKADCDAAEVAVPLKIAKLAPGTYPIKVYLQMKKQALGHQAVMLVKSPPAPEGVHEIKIDRYNRCLLVDGQPFFPMGACGLHHHGRFEGWKTNYYEAQYQYAREAGLNVIMDWKGVNSNAASIADAKARYDLAHKYGLKVIGLPYDYSNNRDLYYGNPKFREAAEKVIAGMNPILEMDRMHPAFIAYYHFDEPQPGLQIDDILESFRTKVHSVDSWHPVYMSLTRYIHDPRWFGTVADLLGAHNYWYVMKPASLNGNAESFAKVDEHARKAHSPTMDLPQLDCWGAGYDGGGFMTPREQRAQTYFALIHGAKSVIYFCMPWKHRLSVSTQKQIAAEVRAIAPALLARDPKQVVTFEPPEAFIPARDYNPFNFPITQVALREDPSGDQVLLAINGSHDGEVTTRFAVSSLTDKSAVEGFFDQKSYPVAEGAFSDMIEPWGTRVYRLKAVKYDKDVPIKIHLIMTGAALTAPVPPPPAAPVYGANLAVNPGFETEGAWGKFETETNNPHDGARALKLAKPAPGGLPVEVICAPIPLQPDTKYRLSGWVRAKITEGRNLPTMFVHSSTRTDGQFRLQAGATLTNWDNAWHELSKTFTSPTGAAESVWIYLRIPPDAAGETYFDDISLQEVREAQPATNAAVKKNLVRNSSFEQARMPGHPDSWHALAWEALIPDPGANGLETNNPFHGQYCFRLAKPESAYENFAYGNPVMLKTDRPYTLSFYARADHSNAVVRVYGAGEMQEYKADQSWRRFTRTFTPKEPGYFPDIYPIGAGLFYIDAVQLEEGTAATEYEPD